MRVCRPEETYFYNRVRLSINRRLGSGTPGGDLVLLQRGGKAWVVRDPALVQEAWSAFEETRQLGAEQSKLGQQQSKLGEKQDVGEEQEALSTSQQEISKAQKALGHDQGKLGAEQAKLGEQQRGLGQKQQTAARAAAEKLSALLDRALRSGAAKPLD
jgi:hypothetical protein